jgi:hypothetical protein
VEPNVTVGASAADDSAVDELAEDAPPPQPSKVRVRVKARKQIGSGALDVPERVILIYLARARNRVRSLPIDTGYGDCGNNTLRFQPVKDKLSKDSSDLPAFAWLLSP